MKAVYETPYAIPELGAEPGDIIVVEPAHPHTPLSVVRQFDRNRLPVILDHIDSLTPLSSSVAAPPPANVVRRWLRRRDPQRPELRVVG